MRAVMDTRDELLVSSVIRRKAFGPGHKDGGGCLGVWDAGVREEPGWSKPGTMDVPSLSKSIGTTYAQNARAGQGVVQMLFYIRSC